MDNNFIEVRRRLAEIRECVDKASDDEAAHVREKDLWAFVLEAISNGCPNPVALAYEALGSREIKFSRWFA